MQKIFVDKKESIASIVERVISSGESDLILVIPKSAVIADSISNLRLLKREAESSGKKLLIESVDEEVLALAKASRIEAVHAFFSPQRKKYSFSDIIPAQPIESVETVEPERVSASKKRPDSGQESIRQPIKTKKISEPEPKNLYQFGEAAGEARPVGSSEFQPRRFFSRKRLVAIFGFLVLLGGGWLVWRYLPRAEIEITRKKTPWQYQDGVIADKAIAGIDAQKHSVPAELFSQDKNLTLLFSASGKKQVVQKAGGTIVVFNAYSSQPQSLVATTRFLSPDGKIFRLNQAMVVPGAKIENGKIIPASIEAQVTADQPGPEYNIGPVSRFTVPGFKNTPKFEGFYGVSRESMAGGFIGEKRVPTKTDIEAAKNKLSESLKTALLTSFLISLPGDFKIFKEAAGTTITKINVNAETDNEGQFSVSAQARVRAIGFREDDLKNLLTAIFQDEYPRQIAEGLALDYGQINADFSKGQLSFQITARANLVEPFSADEFKLKILGQKESQLRRMITQIPGLEKARISLWPFWVRRVPDDPDRVGVAVN